MAGRFAAGVLQRAVKRGCAAGHAHNPRVLQALGGAQDLQVRNYEASHRPAQWDLSHVKRRVATADTPLSRVPCRSVSCAGSGRVARHAPCAMC